MINSNGSKPFEAEPRNGPMNQLNSVPSISGSNQQSTRINCCGILLRGFVARWSRQSGKTHCVAVLLLWSCLRNRRFNVLVLAPAVRQSKIIIRKITGFLSRLPKYVALRPLKTKIEFYNGSRIQAFPNSPETIRGEPGVNLLYADEFSYIKNDKELYEAAVFSLATTNGRFLATSTPGSREHVLRNVHRRHELRRLLKTPRELPGRPGTEGAAQAGDSREAQTTVLFGPMEVEERDGGRVRRRPGQLAQHGTNHQMRGPET